MDQIIKRFCARIDFESYEDFKENFDITTPANFNFAYDVVDEWACIEPDKQALVWCDDRAQKTFTFADIARLSNQAANLFSEHGIGKGDIVMVMLRQRWEYWIIATALCKLGAILSPATIQLTAKDILYRLQSSGARALVALDDDYVVKQCELALESPTDIVYKLLVDKHTDNPNWDDFSTLLASQPEQFERPHGEAASQNSDTMLIYFTSGTTGLAKMVMHDFTHPLGHILTARYWQQVQENQLHCSVSDSGWAKFGWGKIYGQWICGATVFAYDAERFDAKALLQRIEQYQLTTFCVPPTMYRMMLTEDVSAYDLSSVQTFTTAGEPLNPEINLQWQKATGKLIREGFGQSEGPVLLATFSWLTPRPGSMGKPSPLFDIELLDDNGQPVGDGMDGSICICNLDLRFPPGLFVGYYQDEEKSCEAVGGKYYNLHDLAWRDVDGYYTFIGRDDDVIKSSGYRIGPFEVESALAEHPAVLESAVTAVADEIRGSIVKATITLQAGYVASDELAKELQEHVKQVTAPYKYPRIVEFVDQLPKTVSGKVKRAEIRTVDAGGVWEGEASVR
ncbi:MAG: AMP-binding protein [Coriobacteriia bacterium]|nr:AMP-binding protein [Coriobacteriia bacterium]